MTKRFSVVILLLSRFCVGSQGKYCFLKIENGKMVAQGDCGSLDENPIIRDLDAKLAARADSCAEAWKFRKGSRGVTTITRNGKSFQVYCDMATDGGNWIVFQRRFDGSVDFYRYWNDYASGFGDMYGEFWLGLETVHQLIQDGKYELRVDLTDWDNSTAYAKYGNFSITGRSDGYRLTVGGYSGTAGDSMHNANSYRFSARDKDLDTWSSNCATNRYAAWWFSECGYSNLNGRYNDSSENQRGIHWLSFAPSYRYSLKASEMKFRKI